MFLVYKNLGETPKECLDRTRKENGINAKVKMTYAGRLDPMAEGLLILLKGDECKEKEKWNKLDKQYEFEILCGFSSDTYDILGLVDYFYRENTTSVIFEKIKGDIDISIKRYIGLFEQKYPPFSSKTFLGKQLFEYAKEGNILKENDIPKHEVFVSKLELIDSYFINKSDLEYNVISKVSKVNGDFRQDLIKEKWLQALEQTKSEKFLVLKLKVDSGSGFYVREFVSSLSCDIKFPLLTFSIKRVKVGEYFLD
jgi:tRNA pseudouridine(55) synthase